MLRALRTGADWLWVVAGVIAGVGLLANTHRHLPARGRARRAPPSAGPRRALTTPWPWVGGLLALVIWSPYVVWQGQHGWPQLEVSASIAAGESGSSRAGELFLPFQLVLLNPFVAPIWIAGLVRLFRDPALSWCRGFGVVLPAPRRGVHRLRGQALLHRRDLPPPRGRGCRSHHRLGPRSPPDVARAGRAVLLLPPRGARDPASSLPASDVGDTPILDLNYDAGETIGWPTFVDQVAEPSSNGADGEAALLTRNYGEAGALRPYGPALGSAPRPQRPHGVLVLGPPPHDSTTVVVVGFAEQRSPRACGDLQLAGRSTTVSARQRRAGAPIWSAGTGGTVGGALGDLPRSVTLRSCRSARAGRSRPCGPSRPATPAR